MNSPLEPYNPWREPLPAPKPQPKPADPYEGEAKPLPRKAPRSTYTQSDGSPSKRHA